MNLYISNTHFGHSNAISFDNRPFKDREEMEQIMIDAWNKRVIATDDVYILGDFCYRSDKEPAYYLKKLKGRKHLIIGNHDKAILNSQRAMDFFETIERIQEIKDGENDVIMCHFPIADWSGKELWLLSYIWSYT